MSQDISSDSIARHIELVQTMYSAFANRDIPSLLSFISPDVQWGEPKNPHNPAGGTRHGHAGFREWVQIGSQSEEVLSLDPQQFLANADSVAVVGHTKCLARPTGKTYETDFVHLVTFKDGKVVRFQEFFDTYAAGEAFRT